MTIKVICTTSSRSSRPSSLSAATNDYTLAYYVNDACLVLTCIVVLKLHVKKHESVEKTSAALKKIFSVPAVLMFVILGMYGFMFGARDSLYAIYLQVEEKFSKKFQRKELICCTYSSCRMSWGLTRNS